MLVPPDWCVIIHGGICSSIVGVPFYNVLLALLACPQGQPKQLLLSDFCEDRLLLLR